MKTRLVVFIIVLLPLAACNRGVLFEQKHEIAQHTWHKDSIVVFEFQVDQPQQPVALVLEVTHDNSYLFSNLWFFIETRTPDGTRLRDTAEMVLSDDEGRWFGQKHVKTWTMSAAFRPVVTFPAPGSYTLSVQQAMRKDVLPGIHALTLKMTEAGTENPEVKPSFKK